MVKPKTILKGGATYSLINRFQKALPPECLKDLSRGSTRIMVDGRGIDHEVYNALLYAAMDFGLKTIATTNTESLKRSIEIIDGAPTLKEKYERVRSRRAKKSND